MNKHRYFSLQSHLFEYAIKPSNSKHDLNIKPTEKWSLKGLKSVFSKKCASKIWGGGVSEVRLKKLDSFTFGTSKNHLIRNFLRNGRLRVNPGDEIPEKKRRILNPGDYNPETEKIRISGILSRFSRFSSPILIPIPGFLNFRDFLLRIFRDF